MSYLLKLIENSVSYFHTIQEAKKRLKQSGFKELAESENFHIAPKGKYFVVRDDGALIAFILPSNKRIKKAHILMSHGDSPTFRVKPNGEFQKENMLLWALETYGGPIYSTWFNRSLSVAGRVFYESNKTMKSALVDLNHLALIISQLPIHIDRKVNTEGMKINAQEHLNALVSLRAEKDKDKKWLELELKKHLKATSILNHELFVYPREKPEFLGPDKNLFSAPRIDNLGSVAASLEAFCKESKKSHSDQLNMMYIASHEEVGSRTYSGADSPFFKSVIERVFHQMEMTFDEIQQCYAQSMAYSIDGSHALDPKHCEHFEKRHTPLLGEGVTIKIDSTACYANHSELIAKLQKLSQKRQIKIQFYLKKGDQRQGSTIGPLFIKNLGIKTLDIGLAQLSMHSAIEVASLRDYDQLVKMLCLILNDQL